jgi:hypothetical protein
MTPREIIKQGSARNRTLDPKDCVFDSGNFAVVAAWAGRHGIAWANGREVTLESLDRITREETMTVPNELPCCVLALEERGGRTVLVRGWSRGDRLEQARRAQGRKDMILLDAPSLRPSKADDMPEMEF